MSLLAVSQVVSLFACGCHFNEPIRISADLSAAGNNQRPDILLRNPRGFGRQFIIDVAITGIDGQSRTIDDLPDRPLRVRYEQKKVKMARLRIDIIFSLFPPSSLTLDKFTPLLRVSSWSRFVKS